MQTALNRQAIIGDVNPLFKKFVNEGSNPSTYIPADKRREIYDYMSKTNFTKHLDSKSQSNYPLNLVFITLASLPFTTLADTYFRRDAGPTKNV